MAEEQAAQVGLVRRGEVGEAEEDLVAVAVRLPGLAGMGADEVIEGEELGGCGEGEAWRREGGEFDVLIDAAGG